MELKVSPTFAAIRGRKNVVSDRTEDCAGRKGVHPHLRQRERRHSCAFVQERTVVLWAQKDSEGRVSRVRVRLMSEVMPKTQPEIVKNPSTRLGRSMMH